MDNISEHISYAEAIRSDAAKRYSIPNIPDDNQLSNMKLLAEKIFEPIRNNFKVPIFITSFFRSKKLNSFLKGSKNSEHTATRGAAIDLDAHVFNVITNKQIFDYIKYNLDFNQLIWELGNDIEPDWVHVSYNKINNKKEIFKAVSIGNVKKYIKLN